MANPQRRSNHVCKVCGKTFYPSRTPSKLEPYKYCSNECRYTAQRSDPLIAPEERNRQRAREWFYANRERAKEKRKMQYQREREKAIKAAHEWQQAHPDKVKASKLRNYAKHTEDRKRDSAIRQARKRGAEGSFTKEDMQRQYDKQNGLCAYCSIPLSGIYDIDHVIPISRGGSNWPTNLVCACRYCNRSKGDKILSEWLQK